MAYIDPISFYILGIVSAVHTIAIAASILSIFALVVLVVVVCVGYTDDTVFEDAVRGDEDAVTFVRGLKICGYSSLVILSLSLLLLVIVPKPSTYRDIIIAETLQNADIDSVDETKEIIDYVMNYGKEEVVEEEKE